MPKSETKHPVQRVLVLEDNPSDAAMVQALLGSREQRYEFVVTVNRHSFETALAGGPYDLILSDFNLPDFDGLSALKLAKQIFPETPVIILSGEINAEEAVECLKSGATDYLLKQRLERLPSAVQRALQEAEDYRRRHRAEQDLITAHHHTSVLAKIGHELAEATTPRAAALLVLQAARQLIDWDSGWLQLWNETEQELENLAHFDMDEDGQRREVPLSAFMVNDPSPMARRVMQEGPQLLLRENENTRLSECQPFGNNRRSLSLMYVPVRLAGHCIGILSIQSYRLNAYNQAGLELLQNLADHCAGTLARIQNRAALAASEERFRHVWENAADGMRLANAEGRIVAVNQAFCRMMGKPQNEIEGQLLSVLYTEADGPHTLAEFQNKFAHRHFPSHLARQMTLWNGRAIWLEASNCFIESDPGHPLLLSIFRDTTEQKRVESQLLRTQRLESIGNLAGGVAHDLNNALAPILMSVELLREQNPESSDLVDTIAASAQRGADMVRQLLTFAKGTTGERLLIQPTRLFKEMEKIIKGTFPKMIQLRTNYGSNVGTVLGDATQLHQILLNLCVNARDAMPNGGTLTLEMEHVDIDAAYASAVPEAKPGPYIVWRVIDAGTGIPPEVLERIFEPFFSTKGPDKGTGLGLSTVIGIVKGHNGFVRVYSVPGQGSTFAVYLPAAGDSAADASLPAKIETIFRGSGETILVVDDEAAVRQVASSVLSALNFKVLTAADGTEALMHVAEKRDELRVIITDLHMPNMDGLTFVRVIKRMVPGAGIIVASGRLDDREISEFQTIGVNCLLDKPFTQEKLIGAVQTIFQKRSSLAP